MSGGALHQDEMGGGRGEDGAIYRRRVNGVAGERREEGARKRPTRRHCAVRIPKKMLWTRKIQTVVSAPIGADSFFLVGTGSSYLVVSYTGKKLS